MTDEEKISELIILDAAGIISAEDSAELLRCMNSLKDFPWDQLGDYQNLAALLSITVEQKSPSINVKENVLKIVKKSRERKMMAYDKPGHQPVEEENISSFPFVPRSEIKPVSEPVLFIDTELSSQDDLNRPQEFEEVKSRVALIKEKESDKNPSDKPSKIREFRAADFFKEKSEKTKKPKSRNNMLILSIFIMALAGIGFIFIVSSSDDQEEPAELIENHHEELISKSESEVEEYIPETLSEPVGFVESENQNVEKIQSIEKEVPKQNEAEIIESYQTVETIEEENTTPVEKVQIPDVQPTSMIESQISEPPKDLKDKKINETNLNLSKNQNIIIDKNIYLVAAEEMPSPIGGIAGIHEKITYPELARRNGIEGKVYIRAFVDESGTVTKAELFKGIGMGCDEAALNAVLNTKFKAGIQNGQPVKVQITIPITFKQK